MASEARRLVLALEWVKTKSDLETARNAERDARDELIARCFPDGLAEGTNTIALVKGYSLKVVSQPEVEVVGKPGSRGPRDLTAFKAGMQRLSDLGEVGKLLVERLVRWVPAISLAEYRKLTVEQLQCFGDSIAIKRGSPQVELIAP